MSYLPENIYSDYDRFAWFYNRYWGPEFSSPALAIYNALLFPELPAGCRILDLCCGTGQISTGLSERGYSVTGLDGSAAMLHFARENAPGVEFIHGDARTFQLPESFECVISAFDSLNHLMELDELTMVFRRVYEALTDDGIFLFDLNLEDVSEFLSNTLDMVEEDHVCIVRNSYNQIKKLKRYDVTMFQLEQEVWQRADLTLYQRYYSVNEVLGALADAGFLRVKTYDARREFGFNLSDGRMFYLARK
ncbi:MAG: class I SAM-dependent methyltransferase [Acidobacteria bacterium]|nr:class I SAM-dependent methyltransferase [Acidobacteriota bacterium]